MLSYLLKLPCICSCLLLLIHTKMNSINVFQCQKVQICSSALTFVIFSILSTRIFTFSKYQYLEKKNLSKSHVSSIFFASSRSTRSGFIILYNKRRKLKRQESFRSTKFEDFQLWNTENKMWIGELYIEVQKEYNISQEIYKHIKRIWVICAHQQRENCLVK